MANSLRQTFLTGLVEKAETLQKLCNTPVISDDFSRNWSQIAPLGRHIIRGIQDLVDYAAEVEAKLKADARPTCGPSNIELAS
jgi:hypothetical protein